MYLLEVKSSLTDKIEEGKLFKLHLLIFLSGTLYTFPLSRLILSTAKFKIVISVKSITVKLRVLMYKPSFTLDTVTRKRLLQWFYN